MACDASRLGLSTPVAVSLPWAVSDRRKWSIAQFPRWAVCTVSGGSVGHVDGPDVSVEGCAASKVRAVLQPPLRCVCLCQPGVVYENLPI